MQSGLNLALGKITINYNFNHFSLQWHNKRNLKARSDQKTQLMLAFNDLALNKYVLFWLSGEKSLVFGISNFSLNAVYLFQLVTGPKPMYTYNQFNLQGRKFNNKILNNRELQLHWVSWHFVIGYCGFISVILCSDEHYTRYCLGQLPWAGCLGSEL